MKPFRKKQLTQKQQATNKYNTGYRDTNTWVTTKERTLSQLQPIAMDSRTLSRQEKEIKVRSSGSDEKGEMRDVSRF